MSGRGQFWMNIGVTLMFGFYGVCSALYSEFIKPPYEQSAKLMAVDFVSTLILFTASTLALKEAHSCITTDRALDD